MPAIERLLAGSPAPCIVTIRAENEGGTWAGTEQDRISILEAIGMGDHPPAYIDLELEAWRSSANLRQKVRLVIDHASQVRDIATRLILSSHEFGGRPADLLARYAGMVEEEACAVGKIVYMARSLRDCLEMFELLSARAKPLIALAMGEFGTMSRILAPKFGGFLTFAAWDPAPTPRSTAWSVIRWGTPSGRAFTTRDSRRRTSMPSISRCPSPPGGSPSRRRSGSSSTIPGWTSVAAA
jgi:3-dehydroquinate dehydratase/shikimate dehydrogenase